MVVVLVVVVISSRLVDKNPGLLKPGTRAPIYFNVVYRGPVGHPGELDAKKWGTLGSNRLKCTGCRWAQNLLKSVALAPDVLKCGAAPTPHRRAPPQKGLRSTPRVKLLIKSAPRADQSC